MGYTVEQKANVRALEARGDTAGVAKLKKAMDASNAKKTSSSSSSSNNKSVVQANNKKASEIYNANSKNGSTMDAGGVMYNEDGTKQEKTQTTPVASNDTQSEENSPSSSGTPNDATTGSTEGESSTTTPEEGMSEQALLALEQAELAEQTALTEADVVDRNLMNILDDVIRITEAGKDYQETSRDQNVLALEQERDDALAQIELQKEENAWNLQESINQNESDKASTKSEYLNATIDSNGSRFSTMATGQKSINESFAKMQQETYQKASFDLKALGLEENETRNFYASKIADTRLNAQKEVNDLVETMFTTSRDAILGLSDNKTALSQALYKIKLDGKANIMEINAKAVEAERDLVKENMDMEMKFQQMAMSMPVGQSFTVITPNGKERTISGTKVSTASTTKEDTFAGLSDEKYIEYKEKGLITQANINKYRPWLTADQIESGEVAGRKNVINVAKLITLGEVEITAQDVLALDPIQKQLLLNELQNQSSRTEWANDDIDYEDALALVKDNM